jgi:hypothetical protein
MRVIATLSKNLISILSVVLVYNENQSLLPQLETNKIHCKQSRLLTTRFLKTSPNSNILSLKYSPICEASNADFFFLKKNLTSHAMKQIDKFSGFQIRRCSSLPKLSPNNLLSSMTTLGNLFFFYQ